MNVVVEGIDNSGKSTLVAHLSKHLRRLVQASEGPPKFPGEMNGRLTKYSSLINVIFDRHPVISQAIYRSIRSGEDTHGMRPDLVADFYNSKPFFIYCDPLSRGMSGHVFHNGVDTEDHLAQVQEGYYHMLFLYRAWAIRYAHVIYRIGDSMDSIADFAMAYIINGRTHATL